MHSIEMVPPAASASASSRVPLRVAAATNSATWRRSYSQKPFSRSDSPPVLGEPRAWPRRGRHTATLALGQVVRLASVVDKDAAEVRKDLDKAERAHGPELGI